MEICSPCSFVSMFGLNADLFQIALFLKLYREMLCLSFGCMCVDIVGLLFGKYLKSFCRENA